MSSKFSPKKNQPSGASREIERHCVFNLTVDGSKVIDVNGHNFCPEEYSRFKHGDAEVQRKYGHMLADRFIETHRNLLETDPQSLAIAPFAYMHVPTAAGNTMRYFHERLGDFLRSIGKPCVERFHMHKYVVNHSQDHNYAKVSLEERKRILAMAPLSVDEKRLKGKTVVMIDDILITGNSEARIFEILREAKAERFVFWYIARMDPEVASADPGIESRLNQWEIKNVRDIEKIMVPGRFNFNLRNCKFILDNKESDVRWLARRIDRGILHDLYETSLANSYYMDPKYARSVNDLAKIVRERTALAKIGMPDETQVAGSGPRGRGSRRKATEKVSARRPTKPSGRHGRRA
jgi:hypothetical protein